MPSINVFSRVAILSINSQDSNFKPAVLKEGVPLRINKSDGSGGNGRWEDMDTMVTSKSPSYKTKAGLSFVELRSVKGK